MSEPTDIKALDEYLKRGSDVSARYRELGSDDVTFYVPPQAKAPGLPIANAAFQPLQAKGSILFDAAKGRTAAIEEVFQVRGAVALMVLGLNTVVVLEEDQGFAVQILDDYPPKK